MTTSKSTDAPPDREYSLEQLRAMVTTPMLEAHLPDYYGAVKQLYAVLTERRAPSTPAGQGEAVTLPALPPCFPSCEHCARGSKAWQKNGVWLHEGGVVCGAQEKPSRVAEARQRIAAGKRVFRPDIVGDLCDEIERLRATTTPSPADGVGGDEPFCEHGNLVESEDCAECDDAIVPKPLRRPAPD